MPLMTALQTQLNIVTRARNQWTSGIQHLLDVHDEPKEPAIFGQLL